MTPEHTALVARLELKEMHIGDIDKAAAAIRELSGEVGELRASVKEWGCEKCNYVYPGPPQAGFKCITCPRCHGSTMPLSLMKVRAAERERDTLRAELEAEKAAHWRTCQTAAHEAEERDRLSGEVERLEKRVDELCRDGFLGDPPKYVHWHEFGHARAERDTLRAEVAALKADPLHTMLMQQSTGRLVALRAVEAERDTMNACWDAACHDIADRDDKLAALRAEVAALRKSLESSPCPRPIDDDYSVGDCIKNGHCGCDNNAALADKPRFEDGHGNDITHLVGEKR